MIKASIYNCVISNFVDIFKSILKCCMKRELVTFHGGGLRRSAGSGASFRFSTAPKKEEKNRSTWVPDIFHLPTPP